MDVELRLHVDMHTYVGNSQIPDKSKHLECYM
jgi:hypothetical protein